MNPDRAPMDLEALREELRGQLHLNAQLSCDHFSFGGTGGRFAFRDLEEKIHRAGSARSTFLAVLANLVERSPQKR